MEFTDGIHGPVEQVLEPFDARQHYDTSPFEYGGRLRAWFQEQEQRVEAELKAQNPKSFDGLNLRLLDIDIVEAEHGQRRLRTWHQPVRYYQGHATNYAMERDCAEGRTLRHVVHGDGSLGRPPWSPLGNPIGVNVLVLTNQDLVALQSRSEHYDAETGISPVAVRPGEACSSASGTADAKDVFDPDRPADVHPLSWAARRELQEEFGLAWNPSWELIFLGGVRELWRGGLPDLFFAVRVPLSYDELWAARQDATDDWEWQFLTSTRSQGARSGSKMGAVERFAWYVEHLRHIQQAPSLTLLTHLVLLSRYQAAHPEF